MNRLERIEQGEVNRLAPQPRCVTVGTTVRVHVRILEGEKERIQIFEGVVIREQGTRNRKTFTVRRFSSGVWVERIFPVYSPYVTRIDVVRTEEVHRAKLYYLRQRTGRAARLGGKDRPNTTAKKVQAAKSEPSLEAVSATIASDAIPTEVQPTGQAAS
jgi:large subunit ribosomal protein L19